MNLINWDVMNRIWVFFVEWKICWGFFLGAFWAWRKWMSNKVFRAKFHEMLFWLCSYAMVFRWEWNLETTFWSMIYCVCVYDFQEFWWRDNLKSLVLSKIFMGKKFGLLSSNLTKQTPHFFSEASHSTTKFITFHICTVNAKRVNDSTKKAKQNPSPWLQMFTENEEQKICYIWNELIILIDTAKYV